MASKRKLESSGDTESTKSPAIRGGDAEMTGLSKDCRQPNSDKAASSNEKKTSAMASKRKLQLSRDSESKKNTSIREGESEMVGKGNDCQPSCDKPASSNEKKTQIGREVINQFQMPQSNRDGESKEGRASSEEADDDHALMGGETECEAQSLTAHEREQHLRSCTTKMHLDGKQCADCGIPDVSLLENDHLIPEEKILLQNGSGRKIPSMKDVPLQFKGKELRKCDPACTLCHRIRTTERYDDHEQYVCPSRKAKRAFVDADKTRDGCRVCGFFDPDRPYLFDNDHLVPEQKVGAISRLVRGDWDKCVTEMAKCRPICCNCHRKHTSATWPGLEDFTNEEKELARLYLYGTPEQILLLGIKTPVVQVRRSTGEVVAIFMSVSEAAEVTGWGRHDIARCLEGHREHYKNCLWLVPTFEQLKLISDGKGTWRNPNLSAVDDACASPVVFRPPMAVSQFDELTQQLIGVFPSQREAAKEVGGYNGDIGRAMKSGKPYKKSLFRKATADEVNRMVNGKAWRNPDFVRKPH